MQTKRVTINLIRQSPFSSVGLIKSTTAIAISLLAQNTFAGGYQLSDHSVRSLGRAHAGYGVVGDDASAAHFNPAGMALLNKRQVQLGLVHNDIEGTFVDTGSTGFVSGESGNGAEDSLVPSFHFVTPIDDKFHFGLSVTAPFGTHTDYPNNFIGRTNGLKTELVTVDISPSVAYQVNPKLAIGGGISYQTIDANLTGAILPSGSSTQEVEGDGSAIGFNFGVMFSFSEKSRLGMSYRSEIDQTIKGEAQFLGLSPALDTLDFDAKADFTTPATAYFGYFAEVSNNLIITLGARWTEWSSFQELDIEHPTAALAAPGTLVSNTVITTNWDDSWSYMLGADYRLSDTWVIRGGLAFDETPVPDATRSVRSADADRTWYSIGASYQPTNNLHIDFAYRYIEFDEAKVNQNIIRSGGSIGRLVGEYEDIEASTFAVQLNYKF